MSNFGRFCDEKFMQIFKKMLTKYGKAFILETNKSFFKKFNFIKVVLNFIHDCI